MTSFERIKATHKLTVRGLVFWKKRQDQMVTRMRRDRGVQPPSQRPQMRKRE